MTASTRPARAKRSRWEVGASVTVGATRWVFRAIDHVSGAVVLEAMNTTNHGEWWSTTLDKLPERTS